MRVEPFGLGSVVHVMKRGARGMDIVKDDADRWRFVRILYLLNDEYQDTARSSTSERKSDLRSEKEGGIFARPDSWPKRKPLVSILSWVLMPNHFHLLLCETQEGGVSKFMQRLCGSMTTAFNEKYAEKGSIFQGSYKSRTISTDKYLHHVIPYISVKNVFELYPGGLGRALKEFDKAWEWAEKYPFSSFQTNLLGRNSPIIDIEKLQDLSPKTSLSVAKKNAREMFATHMQHKEDLERMLLESW
jgi:hypothetical protein